MPARRKYSLGIDFGTESARLLLVDVRNGSEIATVVHPYRHGVIDRVLPGDRVPLEYDTALQDPSDYLDVLKRGIRAALRKGRVNPRDVLGLGISFTSCTMLPIDSRGEPLCLRKEFRRNPHSWVKLWKHHASQPEADDINRTARERGERFLERYGGKISSEWFFPKVLQVLRDAPEVYQSSAKFIEAGDWIVMRLVDEERRSACQAGYKAMWEKTSGFPSREFFRALDPKMEGIDEKLSPNIYPIGAKAGSLSPEMADVTGLMPSVAVPVAVIDAHAAVPAATVTETGKMVIVMGTSGCHMVCDRKRVSVPGISGCVEDGILPGYFGYEAGQASMGDNFAWFIHNAVPESYEREARRKRLTSHELLELKARRISPGRTGLLALDWLNGNRTPLVDADLSGMILGISLSTTPEEVYRSLIEATCFGTQLVIETFEKSGVRVDEVYACGGLPEKNKLMMQILADTTGREIRVAESAHTSALGAAVWGAVAAGGSGGGYDSIVPAVRSMARIQKRVYTPTRAHRSIYNELYDHYCTLVSYFGKGTNPVMKNLKRKRMTS